MTPVFDDQRIAALVLAMQARVRRGSANRNSLSFAFEGSGATPSAWDTIFVVQAEVVKAREHFLIAQKAVTRWLFRGTRATPPHPITRPKHR
jgi:hypothetical protein